MGSRGTARRGRPHSSQPEKSRHGKEDPAQPKIEKKKHSLKKKYSGKEKKKDQAHAILFIYLHCVL